eukprot:g3758.t1
MRGLLVLVAAFASLAHAALPPWWILNGVKPAGEPKDMGSYTIITFSKDWLTGVLKEMGRCEAWPLADTLQALNPTEVPIPRRRRLRSLSPMDLRCPNAHTSMCEGFVRDCEEHRCRGSNMAVDDSGITSANPGRWSLGQKDRRGPNLDRALDWPLSKEEKRHCLIRICQMELQESEEHMDEQQDEIEELQHEVKVLRRQSLGSQSTAASVSPRSEDDAALGRCWESGLVEGLAVKPSAPSGTVDPVQQEAPEAAESPRPERPPSNREEALRLSLVAYLHERTVGISGIDRLSHFEALIWLMRSSPAERLQMDPAKRARQWRSVLLRPDPARTRQGYNELRSRALMADQAKELRSELQTVCATVEDDRHWVDIAAQEAEQVCGCRPDLFSTVPGEAFMCTENLSDAIASVAQTISAPKGRLFRGAVQIAALLIFGLLPDSESLEEAETDAFWCFFQLLTEMKAGDDEQTRTFRARRVHELLKAYDPDLVEVLDHQGLMVFVATRLGEAFCTRSGLPLESCAQLWDAVLADSQGFAFCDYVVCALLLLRRQELLRLKSDAEALAEALLALPRSVPLDRALRLGSSLRALEQQKVLRMVKAQELYERRLKTLEAAARATMCLGQVSHLRCRRAAKAWRSDDNGMIKALGSFWSGIRERGANALEVGRSVARCAWPRAQAAEEEKPPVEEDLKPLRRRLNEETKDD